MGEKCRSTPRVTIHKRPESSKLCLQIVHNRLRKRPYALCKSCRGSRDLQLWYSSVCPLQFNFLEKNRVKACQIELVWHQRSRARAERRRCALPRYAAVGPLGPDVEVDYHPLVCVSWGRPRRTAFPALFPCSTYRARRGHAAPTLRRPANRRPPYA
jgi:hypothetical protein